MSNFPHFWVPRTKNDGSKETDAEIQTRMKPRLDNESRCKALFCTKDNNLALRPDLKTLAYDFEQLPILGHTIHRSGHAELTKEWRYAIYYEIVGTDKNLCSDKIHNEIVAILATKWIEELNKIIDGVKMDDINIRAVFGHKKPQ